MVSIFIASTGIFSERLVSLWLGLRLKNAGYKIGYFKPIGVNPVSNMMIDDDAIFMKKSLGLVESVETISPVVLTDELIKKVLQKSAYDFESKIKQSFSVISKDKDVVLISSTGTLNFGNIIGLSANKIAELFDAEVLLLVRYKTSMCMLSMDEILVGKDIFKDRLKSVIINAVPNMENEFLSKVAVSYFEEKGVPICGIIPRDKILGSVSVAELIENLGGTVLCLGDKCNKLDELLVENLCIGAMNVESALKYFRSLPNKAVITGGDRADIQIAALETSTKCIILTGNLRPSAAVLGKATEMSVPIIMVPTDTLTTVGRITKMMGHLRLREKKKITYACELLDKCIDYEKLIKLFKISK
ncbi:MAG: phosphotransacetylase family protein [Candidatus Firestonebacteria bacterium]